MLLTDILEKQNDFFHDVFCFIKNQKLSHAYLIETRDYPEKEEIIKILRDYCIIQRIIILIHSKLLIMKN